MPDSPAILEMLAAGIYGHTRTLKGISLADCACLALGMQRQHPVVTADTEWRKLALNIEIVQIRAKRD